jgi:hypothetical protein
MRRKRQPRPIFVAVTALARVHKSSPNLDEDVSPA